MPQAVVTQLVDAVYSEIFMPNDALVKAGTRGEALYFIASGTVAVYNNTEKEVKELEKISVSKTVDWHVQSVTFETR